MERRLIGALWLQVLLWATSASLSTSQGSKAVRDSAQLRAALNDQTVTEIQLEGSIKIDGKSWVTVSLNRSVLIYGEDRDKTVLDFNGASEAVVVQGSLQLELRNLHLKGFPTLGTVNVGNFSRYRAYSQYSWPSIISLNGTKIFHNKTWVDSAYLYTPAFYAQQSALLGAPGIFEPVDSRTFIFHGLHTLQSNLTDQLLDLIVGQISIQINEVKVSSALSAPAASEEGSNVIDGCTGQTLIIGWQSVLIALALAAGILLLVVAVLFVARKPLLARLQTYYRHTNDVELAHPNPKLTHT